ncbi:MAG: metal ABC transporter ATP-binding protein [Patescibacteria group bacterium]|nr:metal ABC transporter ATP-binding protein [Patescibacteria group bacterium]
MLLKVNNLSVDLDGENIIKNLSFEVSKGEIMTILGPNGAGKSVLIRTLLGFLPHKGEITWDKKYKIGYLPQGLNQLLTKDLPLTVKDFFNLKEPIPDKNEIVRYLSMVGLKEDVLSKNTGNLSGGEFQRVLMAWVLIGDPDILFLDEPTTGIDLGGGETIYSLLKKIREEKDLTIILITHDLNIVYGFTDKVLCISRKEHACFGKPHEVMSPQNLEDIFGTKLKYYEHK